MSNKDNRRVKTDMEESIPLHSYDLTKVSVHDENGANMLKDWLKIKGWLNKKEVDNKDILIKKLINELELISEVYLEGIVNKFDCDFTDEEIEELIKIRDSKEYGSNR